MFLKLSADVATDNHCTIAVEVPGVDKKSITLERIGDTLIVEGEKATGTISTQILKIAY